MEHFPVSWFRHSQKGNYMDVLSTRPSAYAKTLVCHSALPSTSHMASIKCDAGRELLQFFPIEKDPFLQKIIKDLVDWRKWARINLSDTRLLSWSLTWQKRRVFYSSVQNFLETNSELGLIFFLAACEHSVGFSQSFTSLPWSTYWLGWLFPQGTLFAQSWGSISHLALCNNFSITALCNAKQTFSIPLVNMSCYSIHKNSVAHAKTGQLAHRAFVEAPKALQNLFSVMSKSCMCKQCCRQQLSEGRAEGCTETHLLFN